MQFSTRDLAVKSGVSTRTIAKYPQLWKHTMETVHTDRFATDLHEYNAVNDRGASVSWSAEFGALFAATAFEAISESAAFVSADSREQIPIDWLGSGESIQEGPNVL